MTSTPPLRPDWHATVVAPPADPHALAALRAALAHVPGWRFTVEVAPTPPADDGPTYAPGPVVIRRAGAKGHGLFAARPIRAGEAFCEQPAVIVDEAATDVLDAVPAVKDYEFDWDATHAAYAMGPVAFMNHDEERANVTVERDATTRTMRIRATRDVAPGEELCFTYRCGPWWET